MNGDIHDEYYEEGIYVGYRYFDTFDVTPAYPFGYGKSYTTFDVKTEEVTADAKQISVKVRVTITGATYSGKEVVQVYYSAPAGKLEKPYQELAPMRRQRNWLRARVKSLLSLIRWNAWHLMMHRELLMYWKREPIMSELV